MLLKIKLSNTPGDEGLSFARISASLGMTYV
jgi:hypothetical protein